MFDLLRSEQTIHLRHRNQQKLIEKLLRGHTNTKCGHKSGDSFNASIAIGGISWSFNQLQVLEAAGERRIMA